GQVNPNPTNVVSSITPCVPRTVQALNNANPCSGGSAGKSPAADAGLKPGDKIISVAGRPVGNWNQLHTTLTGLPPGAAVPAVIKRAGHDLHIQVTLAPIPGRSVPFLGVEPSVYQRSTFLGAWSYAGNQFANTITSSASAIARLPSAVPDLFSSNRG